MGTTTRTTRSGSKRTALVPPSPPVSSFRVVGPANFRKAKKPRFRPVRETRTQVLQKRQDHEKPTDTGDAQQMNEVKITGNTSTSSDVLVSSNGLTEVHAPVLERATTQRASDVLCLEAVAPVILKRIAAEILSKYEAGEIPSAANGKLKQISTSGCLKSLKGIGYNVTSTLNCDVVPDDVPAEGGWMYSREAWHRDRTFSRTTPAWMPINELDACTQDIDAPLAEAYNQFVSWKKETPKLMEWYRKNTRCVETRPIVKHALDEVHTQTKRRRKGQNPYGDTVLWSSSLVVVPPVGPGNASHRRSHVFLVVFVLPSRQWR